MPLDDLCYVQLKVILEEIQNLLLLYIIIILLVQNLPDQVKQLLATDTTMSFLLKSLVLFQGFDYFATDSINSVVVSGRLLEETTLDQYINVVKVLQQMNGGQARVASHFTQTDVGTVAEVHHQTENQCLILGKVLLVGNLLEKRIHVFKERGIQFRILSIAHHTLNNLKLCHLFNDLFSVVHWHQVLDKLIIVTGKNRHGLDQTTQEQAEGSHSNMTPEGKRGKNAHPQHEQREADDSDACQK